MIVQLLPCSAQKSNIKSRYVDSIARSSLELVYLKFTDRTSKKPQLSDITTLTHRYGVPQYVRSDRGSHFANSVIKEFMALSKTPLKLALAYSSKENAIVERAYKQVNRHIVAVPVTYRTVQLIQSHIQYEIRRLGFSLVEVFQSWCLAQLSSHVLHILS